MRKKSPFYLFCSKFPLSYVERMCVTLTDVRRLPWAIYLHHQRLNWKMDVWELIAVVFWKEGGLWKWEEESRIQTEKICKGVEEGRLRDMKAWEHWTSVSWTIPFLSEVFLYVPFTSLTCNHEWNMDNDHESPKFDSYRQTMCALERRNQTLIRRKTSGWKENNKWSVHTNSLLRTRMKLD